MARSLIEERHTWPVRAVLLGGGSLWATSYQIFSTGAKGRVAQGADKVRGDGSALAASETVRLRGTRTDRNPSTVSENQLIHI
jgi:hypothetical protein